jgi:hypothetical protein
VPGPSGSVPGEMLDSEQSREPGEQDADARPDLNNAQSQSVGLPPGQDIGNILNVTPASIATASSVPAKTRTKRKAAGYENDGLPNKRGRLTNNENSPTHANLESAENPQPMIVCSGRERKVTEKVATKLAEEAAAKEAKEVAKKAKAKKGKGKKKGASSTR